MPNAAWSQVSRSLSTALGRHGWQICAPMPVTSTRPSGPNTKHQIPKPAAAKPTLAANSVRLASMRMTDSSLKRSSRFISATGMK